MTNHIHFISIPVGIIACILLPIVTWFNRKRSYAAWAKIASLIACAAGLGWGFLAFALLHSSASHSSRQAAVKNLLAGICIGIVISMWISKPYERRAS